jgi:hypothetical protein
LGAGAAGGGGDGDGRSTQDSVVGPSCSHAAECMERGECILLLNAGCSLRCARPLAGCGSLLHSPACTARVNEPPLRGTTTTHATDWRLENHKLSRDRHLHSRLKNQTRLFRIDTRPFGTEIYFLLLVGFSKMLRALHHVAHTNFSFADNFF